MAFLHNAIHNPRKLFLRRALFQVHLWAGIVVSVYVVVIALSGAGLVFEDELTSMALPKQITDPGRVFSSAETTPISVVMEAFGKQYPGAHVTNLIAP